MPPPEKAAPGVSDATKTMVESGAMDKPPRFDQEAKGDKFLSAAGVDIDSLDEKDRAVLDRLKGRFMASPFPSGVRGDPEKEKKHPFSYPPPFKKGQGSHSESLVRNWKQQKRTKCGEAKCYHVLEPKRFGDINNGNQFVVPTVDGGQAIAAECSWDPRHGGGLQFIPIVAEKDEE